MSYEVCSSFPNPFRQFQHTDLTKSRPPAHPPTPLQSNSHNEKAFALSLPHGPWQIFLTSLNCLSLLQDDRQLLPPVQEVLNTSRQAVVSAVPRPAAQHLLGTFRQILMFHPRPTQRLSSGALQSVFTSPGDFDPDQAQALWGLILSFTTCVNC